MPIHPSGQLKKMGPNGSPYAVRDFYAVEPAYGTKDDLRRLIGEAHRRGMRVILDIVADHTAFDSVMMAHPEYYKHDKAGQLISPHGWNDVAALDYGNPALRKYMIDMLLYWVREFRVDGFRCDAAGEVPTSFWDEARAALDRVNPSLLMLAEASKPELQRTAFSLDYDWPLLAQLDEVMTKGTPASEIRATVEKTRKQFPRGAQHMLISDDHDTDRAIAKYGAPGAIAASALLFTMEGVPLLYNGMEVGDTTPTAGPALFETLPVYWPSARIHPDFPKFYGFIVPLRARRPALWKGSLEWVHNSDESRVITYVRRFEGDEVLVAVNLSGQPFRGTVEAGPGPWQRIADPFSGGAPVAVPALSLDAYGFRFFERKNGGS